VLITYHLGRWVDDLHLFEDSGAIVGDENFAFGVLDLKGVLDEFAQKSSTYHFVHSAWA